MNARDSYAIQTWYVKAYDRLCADPTLSVYAPMLVSCALNLGDFTVNQLQWLVSAQPSDIVAYAKSL